MEDAVKIEILIVDDNVSTLHLIRRMLEKEGVDILCASSGSEALNAVSSHDPALVLMDVVMAGTSGMEAAKMIRNSGEKNHVPIIFMTGHDKAGPIEFKGYEIGAVDFIYKPINPLILKSKVRVFTELYRREKRLAEANRELERTLTSLQREVKFRQRAHQALKRSEAKYKNLFEMSRDMESQLRQVQKMEAVGTLAGGIAHDFNNILAAIMGYIELAQFDVPDNNPARESVDQVLKATHRARKLVGQILAFSRQSSCERKPLYIQSMVEECVGLLRASIPSTVAIGKHLCPTTHAVNADSTQIHQVIMNLCTNAYHAMGGEGGRIDITVSPLTITGEDAPIMPGPPPGQYMKLEVRDTGCGMDGQTTARIFDPYFTTKAKGEGTGMGLSVVHGIVKAHGGAIEVESDPGHGSLFTLYFPVITMDAPDHADLSKTLPLGHERILFVDDEEALVDLAAKILERLGYQVVSETSSLNALERFKADPEGFDLLITDMTMPDLTGLQLARKIKAMRPDVPVILCTGYHKELSAQKIKEAGIDHLLLKPLKIMDLATMVRAAIEPQMDVRACSHG